MEAKNRKALIYEIIRYLLVGGLAFLADYFVFFIFEEFIFKADSYLTVSISTAAGFCVGLAVNWILSITFVFSEAKSTSKGKTPKDMALFAIIGIIGLVLTEIGMLSGLKLLELINIDFFGRNSLLVKPFVTAAVLAWNYLGRKILIFK